MTAVLEPIVTVPQQCSVAQVCDLLGISSATFYARLKDGRLSWLREVTPRVGRPKYRGADIAAYLNGTIDDPRYFKRARRA